MISLRSVIVLSLITCGMFAANRHLLAEHNSQRIGQLIDTLSSDSYTARTSAEQTLLWLASQDSSAETLIRQQLSDSMRRSETEIRNDLEGHLSRSKILARLRQRAAEVLRDRFLHDPSFKRESVAGWEAFRKYAGDDAASRMLFVELLRRDIRPNQLFESAFVNQVVADFDSIDPHDMVRWTAILVAACHHTANQQDGRGTAPSELTIRLGAALRCEGTGPMPGRESQGNVIGRLITHFLQSPSIDARDRIVIAMRYRCHQITRDECQRILANPSQSPSRIVTALLAISALEPQGQEVATWINHYQSDTRVSHVWRSMVPPKTTRRTQIRDVAYALQLRRAGHDPRDYGFDALVADPVLVYRPYSLGFESDADRQRAVQHRAVQHRAVQHTVQPR